ncbi:MAG: hypothetical protein E2P06_14225, partial [Acidobacteria bacterium]
MHQGPLAGVVRMPRPTGKARRGSRQAVCDRGTMHCGPDAQAPLANGASAPTTGREPEPGRSRRLSTRSRRAEPVEGRRVGRRWSERSTRERINTDTDQSRGARCAGGGQGHAAVEFAQGHEMLKISTGDILRDAVRSGTELGHRAKATMDAGGLVDDQLMIAIVRERLSRADAAGGFVLDGFPRTVAQATALDEIMAGQGALIVVDIAVPDDALVERLARRRVCAQCGNATRIATGEAGGAMPRCEKCGGELVLR